MPVLVIAVSCLVIFGIMGILGVAAVHCERRQQERERAAAEASATEIHPEKVSAKAV